MPSTVAGVLRLRSSGLKAYKVSWTKGQGLRIGVEVMFAGLGFTVCGGPLTLKNSSKASSTIITIPKATCSSKHTWTDWLVKSLIVSLWYGHCDYYIVQPRQPAPT